MTNLSTYPPPPQPAELQAQEEGGGNPGGAASSSSGTRAQRSDTGQERSRKTDVSVQAGGGAAEDFRTFDVTRSMTTLRSDHPEVRKRTLQRLHVRTVVSCHHRPNDCETQSSKRPASSSRRHSRRCSLVRNLPTVAQAEPKEHRRVSNGRQI